MKLCGFEVGDRRPFFLMAGPCVIESEQMVLDIAGFMHETCEKLGVPYIFKASFDKANRTSGASFRGPGLAEGLRILSEVKKQIGVPVVTRKSRSPRLLPLSMCCKPPPFCAVKPILFGPAQQAANPSILRKGSFYRPTIWFTSYKKREKLRVRHMSVTTASWCASAGRASGTAT